MGRTKQGFAPPAGPQRTYSWITETINANKLGSAEVLVTEDKDYLQQVLAAIQDPTARMAMSPRALAKIKSEIVLAKRDARFSSRIAERKDVLDAIQRAI